MRLDRWLWRLQVALIASTPLLVLMGVMSVVLSDGSTRFEYVYEDGTRVDMIQHADPVDRWINFVVLIVTALWQVGLGAALFCLRRIAHMMPAPSDGPLENDR